MDLLQTTTKGIYCAAAKIFIDPWMPVDYALITHGHSDHSRWGHKKYLCTDLAAPAIRYRLGDINLETVKYNETKTINGVKFSFHPAGHIPGSAQIRVEYKGEVWVASGDYKLENDGLSTPFEPVRCHSFITESTFGLPVFKWRPQEEIFAEINDWWRSNAAAGKTSFLTSYSLGKSQRVLRGLDTSIGKIYTHAAIENMNEVIRGQGIELPPTTRIVRETDKKVFPGNLVLATPSAINTPWMRKMKPLSIGIASGWMTIRGARRRRAVDRGFVLSDHADWNDLNTAIKETDATRVVVTHGYTTIFTNWLLEQGYQAESVQTDYGEEEEEKEELKAE